MHCERCILTGPTYYLWWYFSTIGRGLASVTGSGVSWSGGADGPADVDVNAGSGRWCRSRDEEIPVYFSGSDPSRRSWTSHVIILCQWALISFFSKPTCCSSSMMHFSSALPATLMDLTILRLSGVLSPKTPASTLALLKRPSTFRRLHQAVALTSTNVPKFAPIPDAPVLNESHGRYASFTFYSVINFLHPG